MNPILAKVTGSIQEDDAVPVPAGAVTRTTFRNRAMRKEQEERQEGVEETDRSALRAVLGEGDEAVIPDEAEEMDDSGLSVLPKQLKPIKDIVQEPSHPSGEREKLITPYAALTAPDATPEAMTPLDPSKVPGSTAQTFTAAELETADGASAPEGTPVAPEEGPGVDKAMRAMDVLLGRIRTGAPASDRDQAEKMGAITTEAQAYAALKVESPAELTGNAVAAAQAALVPRAGMPEPVAANLQAICEAFRKFNQ